MTCNHVTLPGGFHAIVCTARTRRRCKCGNRVTLLCDWKTPAKRSSPTCDAPLCHKCTTSPATGKDLCPKHAKEWAAMITPPPQEELEL